MTKLEVLRKYFGHTDFRGAQERLIDCILSGRDCLGVMPTGAGKSICFQVPAIMMNGTAVVISPLISLMKDQVEALIQNGVSAACINSALSETESREIYTKAAQGCYDLLYVAPERLLTPRFLELAKHIEISLVAVDEAHCVSQWGQDFRPSYLDISAFVKSLPERPVVAAFTATATERVKRDITELLGLREPLSVTTGFDRPNLFFEVRHPKDRDEELLKLLRGNGGGSVIVYCSTRKNVERVCGHLNEKGFRAAAYHAGLSQEERTRAQEDFLFDRLDAVVATNAFGMGIDKSNVRLVIHYNCPKDMESYYQEAGRAGRDGGSARCVMFYSESDKSLAEFMIKHSHDDPDLSDDEYFRLVEHDRKRLEVMVGYAKTKGCLRAYILRYFGEDAKDRCGCCGSCTKGDEMRDITVEAQKIISCVFRLKQRGLELPIEDVCGILRGKLSENGLGTLSTFGIMRGETKRQVMRVARYLCDEGYIEERGNSKVCAITPRADEFIKQRGSLIVRFRSAALKAANEPRPNPELFEELRAVRSEFAKNLGVPPYVVFADTSLWSMCELLPRDNAQFLRVSGVGSRKAERYGRKFLAVINNYCKIHDK